MHSETQIALDAHDYIKMMRETVRAARTRVNASVNASESATENATNCESLNAVESTPKLSSSELDSSSIAVLIRFFMVLDRWDREVTHDAKTM